MPGHIDGKISAVDSYIWTNLNTQMHETQLPCILNNNFYKNKLYNYQNTTILKRLTQKKSHEEIENGFGRYDQAFKDFNMEQSIRTTRLNRQAKTADVTVGLQKESMIRRNKLTLEHIIHQRGKNATEDEACADLHRELRLLEQQLKPKDIITIQRTGTQ